MAVRRRIGNLQSATSWSQIPVSLGTQGSAPAASDSSSNVAASVTQPYRVLWLVLAKILVLATPSRAHSGELVLSSSAVVCLPGEVCDPTESHKAEEGSTWWLLALWCLGIIVIWEACKWTVHRTFLRKTAQTAASQLINRISATGWGPKSRKDSVQFMEGRLQYRDFGTSGGCPR